MPSGATALSAQQLVKQYPSGETTLTVLNGVDLDVARGAFVALRGPSGSGKTTLLNLFASLDTPTSGSVTVLDQRVDKLSERKRTRFRADHIGLVFQESNLIPGLSALENTMLGRLPWEKRGPLAERATKLLERIGLGDRLQHPPSHLSGGERQRVGIARALVGNPEILLADEPTGNLDADTTAELIRLLGELRTELGITVFVATHDEQVAGGADRIIRIEKGNLHSGTDR
jgi:ABC-type lipoprotein export system ATPase subunit